NEPPLRFAQIVPRHPKAPSGSLESSLAPLSKLYEYRP
ncbi:MAG: hypothetical protein ACI9LT_003698, partial [Pseudoalteromonas distincta]